MKELVFLLGVLKKRALVPRYCRENIEYLNIQLGGQLFHEIVVLQKCFCDIPLHKLTDTFPVRGTGDVFEALSAKEKLEIAANNSHPDFYGSYAIALSKQWGEKHHLQPVQYCNEKSNYVVDFSKTFTSAWGMEDIPDEFADDILRRLSYMKPLRGTMPRTYVQEDTKAVKVELLKNFHDEREWRYVPSCDALKTTDIGGIIANQNILNLGPGIDEFSRSLEDERHRQLWLDFGYEDIRYLIVPDALARSELIDAIWALPTVNFNDSTSETKQKCILISKILVLAEISEDW